ncbi:MAG: hypothetical protein R3B70_02065 [Polyangiaceae bacterium]
MLGVAASLFASGCCGPGLGRTTPLPPAEYESHIASRRAEYGPELTVLAAPPFAVVGDGPPDWVKQDTYEVVNVAARLLKEQYFDRDPARSSTS